MVHDSFPVVMLVPLTERDLMRFIVANTLHTCVISDDTIGVICVELTSSPIQRDDVPAVA